MEQNHNMLRGISENGGIVFYGVDSTEIVREMERLHKTSAVTTAALGRLLTAASMMGIMLKSTQDSVTLQYQGRRPRRPFAGCLRRYRQCQGLCGAPSRGAAPAGGRPPERGVQPSAKTARWMLSAILGMRGAIHRPGAADLLARLPRTSRPYFAISEQVPTVCALGVLVDRDLTVRCAGGFIVQLLPGATDGGNQHIWKKTLRRMPSVTAMLRSRAASAGL